jgi:hypothetical protein
MERAAGNKLLLRQEECTSKTYTALSTKTRQPIVSVTILSSTKTIIIISKVSSSVKLEPGCQLLIVGSNCRYSRRPRHLPLDNVNGRISNSNIVVH